MNRFQKRKLKNNIYKHGNTILYGVIFLMASVITVGAALNRTDKISYIDEKKIVESVALTHAETQNLAAEANTTDEETTTTDVTTVAKTTIEEPTTPEETTQPQTITSAVIRVTADTLSVRKEPSTDAQILGLVDQNEEFTVVSTKGEWIEINYQGQTGYVNAAYVTTIE